MRVALPAADESGSAHLRGHRGGRQGGRIRVIWPAFQRGKKTLIPADFQQIPPSSHRTTMGRILHPLFALLASVTRQDLARQVAYLKEQNRSTNPATTWMSTRSKRSLKA